MKLLTGFSFEESNATRRLFHLFPRGSRIKVRAASSRLLDFAGADSIRSQLGHFLKTTRQAVKKLFVKSAFGGSQ